jgi:hypothetical protein
MSHQNMERRGRMVKMLDSQPEGTQSYRKAKNSGGFVN